MIRKHLGSKPVLNCVCCRLVEEVRRGLEGGMAERAKQDVESGAVAQSIVDSRGPTSNNRLYLLLEESYPVRHVSG
jgi:hypothetical protein